MTENTAPDIATSFIQMVDAYKAKPELEAKIRFMNDEIEAKSRVDEANQRRIAELESALASASADKERLTRERDEAMFRSLELEEKTNAVSDLVAKLEGLVRPEPVAKVEAPAPVSETTSEVGTSLADREWKNTEYGNVEGATSQGPDFSEIEPNAEQRSNVEDQHRDYHEAHKDSIQSEQGKSDAPNWNAPTKSEQNASKQSMGDTNMSEAKPEPRPNEGKPYDQKPYWVSDANWKAEGGQGPYDNGSWEAPWERWRA